MKSIFKIPATCALAAMLAFSTGCKDILEETVRTEFTTDYFKTPEGIQSAIITGYAGLRFNYGPNGALAIANVGTDEWTYGDQPRTGADGDVFQLGNYEVTSTQSSVLTPWNRSFFHINLMNGVLEFAPDVPVSEGAKNVIMAEARYLRAHYYLILVQQFGKVPLDLGSGELVFNTSPGTGFYRLTEGLLARNYQAMIDDLTYASENLPDQRPANAFRASKAAALHLLAKVYLFRGYSEVSQAGDFQKAYDTAMELINNKAKYGVALMQDFGDVHRQGNDYNSEIIFSVERMPLNNAANESPNPGSDFSNKVNIANNMFNADYTSAKMGGKTLIPTRVMEYGRPLRRYAPTKWLINTAFADKLNDSRYDNSFRTVWYVKTLHEPGTAEYDAYVADMASIGLAMGDTAIYLAPTDARAAQLKAQGKKYFVLGPSEYYTNQNTAYNLYPNLRKYDDTQRAHFNDVSGRPFIVSKLGETYLLAAEAAMQTGRNAEAAELINVLRKRAAFRPGLSAAEIQNRYDAIQVSASDINLDFILNERTRELAGESVRWVDLAMRGKLVERVKAHNPDAQNIQPHHVLRPIPQSQLDAVSDPDKAKYQNPGY